MKIYVVHGWKYGPTHDDKWLPDTLFESRHKAVKYARAHSPKNPGEYIAVHKVVFPVSALEVENGWRDGEYETVYFKSYNKRRYL